MANLDIDSLIEQLQQLDDEFDQLVSTQADNERLVEENAAQSDMIEDYRSRFAIIRSAATMDDDAPPIDIPLPPAEGDVIQVAPGESIQAAIGRAEPGDTIELESATYYQQIDLAGKREITIEGNGATISGYREMDIDWNYDGNLHSAPWNLELFWWQNQADSREHFNNARMRPELATLDGKPLMWQPDGLSALQEGQFWIGGGEIFVKLAADQDIEDVRFYPVQYLLRGNEDCSGITIKDLNFYGCSNTGKSGAVNFPGSGWDVQNIRVEMVNTIGVEFGQGGERSNMRSTVKDSHFKELHVVDAGQMGFWGSCHDCNLTNWGHTGSNWKGFDAWWEGSIKLENWLRNTSYGFYADDVNGQGLWFDIHNHNNRFYDTNVDGAKLAGIMVEHHAEGNKFYRTTINNVTLFEDDNPNNNWDVASAVYIQSNVNQTIFEGLKVSNVDEAVRINNSDERGLSNGNSFTQVGTQNIRKEKYKVLGNLLENVLE